MDNIHEFVCKPEKLVYNSDEFKIYGASINSYEYPNIKINKYNTVTIKGNLSELSLGVAYRVKAQEIIDSYGSSYNVIYIKREKPTTFANTKIFLYEILTPKQADTLMAVYPDIVNKIIENKIDDIDLTKLKGIGEYTFNIIKNKVIENFKLADLVEEFQGLFSLSVIKKLYDRYTSVEKIKEVIREEPYECLCRLGGIGFKTADDLLIKLYKHSEECKITGEKPVLCFEFDLIKSYQRAKACVDYILDMNETNGNTYMSIRELKEQFDSLIPNTQHNLILVLKNDKDIVFDKDKLVVCKKTTYETEKYISEKVTEALNINKKWNCDCSLFKKLDEFELSEQQSRVMEYVCNYNLVVLIGFAGSGKSSSTKALINMLKHYNKTYALFAPTGRAAKVLTGFTNEPVKTIHRGLGYIPPQTWTYNEEYPLPYDIVIVDEASMIDIFLFKKLLEAIDFNKTKLLIIGDDAQIPSVGAGNVLYDLIQNKHIKRAVLDKVFRYGEGGLSTVATDTRLQKKYLDNKNNSIQYFGTDKSYVFIPIEQDRICNYAVQLYTKLIKSGYQIEDVALITCYNVGDYGTVALNKKIQQTVNANQKEKILFGNSEFRLNDIVMNYVNDYKAIRYNKNYIDTDDTTFVANGDTGRVVKILKNAMVVDYDGMLIYIPKSSMKNIRLAYAIGTHKSQGSQYKVVIFLTPRSHTFMLNSNLLYVGETRAREKCYHLGEIRTVENALRKKENFQRKTMLNVFLK